MNTKNEIQDNVKKMLPPKKASKYLGISEHYLRKRIEEDSIPYIKSGNRTYILLDALMEQLNEEAQDNIRY